MTDEPMNDAARWAAMQDAVNARSAENRERAKLYAGNRGPLKAGGDRPTPPTVADLDAIHARREEAALTSEVQGAMEFARCIAAAPSLVAEFEKLKGQGRA